nr:ankyrin repeat domain-containing protein [Rickettsia endosymbiont of Ceutorhynchus assimilis]
MNTVTNEVSRDVLVQQLLNINLENKTFINDKVPDIIDEWNDNMVDNITFNLGQSKASTPMNTVINEVSSNPLESLDIAQESNIYANDSGILESDVDYVDNTTFNPGQSKASTPVNTVTNEVSRDVLVQQLLNINLENKTFINDKVPDIIDEWNDNMVDNITFNLGQSKASTPVNTVINEVSSNPLESLDIAQESNIYANDSGILESDVDYVDNTTFNPGQSKASTPVNTVTNEVSRDVLVQQLLNINLENKTFINDKVPDIIDEWNDNMVDNITFNLGQSKASTPVNTVINEVSSNPLESLDIAQESNIYANDSGILESDVDYVDNTTFNPGQSKASIPMNAVTNEVSRDVLAQQLLNINLENKTFVNDKVPDIIDEWDENLPLHDAVKLKHKSTVELLLSQGAEVNQTDKYGKTPLHYAAESGCKDIVELLLPQGVDVNILDQHYKTPLHYAAESGCKDIVELLLPQGVDVNILDQHYKTPLHYAAESGCKDIVELLLPQCFNINQTDNYGKTPLHYAAESGCKDIVELLLPQGVDVNILDQHYKTPLHYAAESGCKDIVELLLPQGVDVNILDQHYKTPLHYAAESGCKDIVELLLPQCFNINQTDNYGKTPLHYAAESGCKDIVELLLLNVLILIKLITTVRLLCIMLLSRDVRIL